MQKITSDAAGATMGAGNQIVGCFRLIFIKFKFP